MRGARRFSQAIAEGDGISLIVEIDSAAAAQSAEEAGAEAVLVHAGDARILPDVRGATTVPVVFLLDGEGVEELEGTDACVVAAADVDDEWVEHVRLELGADYELVVRIDDEDELVAVLDRLDPEVLVLAAPAEKRAQALEHVLGLLPDVPAGKLAVADLGDATREMVAELERAGVDAVIVTAAGADVADLVGGPPPGV